jgi:hypothetical protein
MSNLRDDHLPPIGHLTSVYPIVKYKYFRKNISLEALEAAGSDSNLGFNYSHLENQAKESLTEVVT